MRSKAELQSEEFNDDMSELCQLLDEAKIKYVKKRHEAAEPQILDCLGYYPTGEWHIYIGDISVIRGMVTFGDYEVLGGKYKEVTRFKTVQELLDDFLENEPK